MSDDNRRGNKFVVWGTVVVICMLAALTIVAYVALAIRAIQWGFGL